MSVMVETRLDSGLYQNTPSSHGTKEVKYTNIDS